jgi:hypothetical protein
MEITEALGQYEHSFEEETRGAIGSATNLANLFTYHAPTDFQVKQYEWIRDKGFALALEITDNCPPGIEREAAILRVREAVMLANAAIACAKP